MKNKLLPYYLLIIILFSMFVCSCRQEISPESFSYKPSYPVSFKILTQNAMLIPLEAVAPSYRHRASILAEKLAGSDFKIAGLQEIFWDRSQNIIINAWYESLKTQKVQISDHLGLQAGFMID